MRKGSVYHVALFSTMAWCSWQRRNRLRVRQSVWPLYEISDRAKALVVEFFDSNKQEVRPRYRCPTARWVPPGADWYKANYDVAIFDSLGYAGLGVVIRDSSGNVIAALSQKIGLLHSVDTAEALVALRALQYFVWDCY